MFEPGIGTDPVSFLALCVVNDFPPMLRKERVSFVVGRERTQEKALFSARRQARLEQWYNITQGILFGAVLLSMVIIAGAVVSLVAALGSDACDSLPEYEGHATRGHTNRTFLPPIGLKIAFLADQGLGKPARSVLDLVGRESADMVFYVGDLDYKRSPGKWQRMILDRFGTSPSIEHFMVLGNHDVEIFAPSLGAKYARIAQSFHERASSCCCEGRIGAKALCTYKGLAFLQIGKPAVCNNDVSSWVRDQFESLGDSWPWKICLFHMQMHLMQMGGKRDNTGWGLFEACREAGALVVNGHDHRYARTHLLSDYQHGTVANSSSVLHLEPGRSVLILSALGGNSIRRASSHLRSEPWWAASLSAGDPNEQFGACFCRFEGSRRANCYFKTTDDIVIDQFVLTV